jgi:hypothetical protein
MYVIKNGHKITTITRFLFIVYPNILFGKRYLQLLMSVEKTAVFFRIKFKGTYRIVKSLVKCFDKFVIRADFKRLFSLDTQTHALFITHTRGERVCVKELKRESERDIERRNLKKREIE